MVNRAIASVGAHTVQMYNGMDETETDVLCVCVTMSQEDMILSHVYLYVYVVSLITKLFYKFKPYSLYASVDLSQFQSGGQLRAFEGHI